MSGLRLSGLLALILSCFPLQARAQDLKEPYRIQIVVHFERHRLLTDIFRQQFTRELRDAIQAALGDLARVDARRTHPALDDIRSRGLSRALDGYRNRDGRQVHFVLVSFSGAYYEIQTRQYNGSFGLPSPVVRKGRTRDPAFVTRTATLLLERDLGLLGTVVSEPDGRGQVRVALKGGELGVDLRKWVKKGEVFSLVRVEASGQGQPVEWAVLQVVEPPEGGVCVCKLFSRYRLSRVSGLRCVLLGTKSGPLRLRLLQQKRDGGTEPLRNVVALQIRRQGFEGEEATLLRTTGGRGQVVTTAGHKDRGQFDRLALVSVLTGETVRARFPVPILDDGVTPVVLPPTSDDDDLLTLRFRSLQRNVIEAYLVQSDLFKTINELTAKPEERAKAIALVRQTLQRSQQDYSDLMSETEAVKREIEKLQAKDRPVLDRVVERLKLIKSGENDLRRTIDMLEKIEKEENDPKKKEWLVQEERAKLYVKEGELDKAIAIYEKAPPEFQSAALKNHLADLKKEWEPVDANHAKARKFIYETWPGLDTPGVKARMKEARDAFEVCKKVDDFIGPKKLLRGTEAHAQRILKELNELKPGVNIDDDKPAKLIQDLVPELRQLDADVRAYLEKKKS